MPYRWTETSPQAPKTLLLWPHRSLPARGFAWFIGLTAALLSVPLLAVLGSPILWALLPFLLATVAGIWIALRRNNRDRSVTETLTLTRDTATLVRREPDGTTRTWQANSHWVRVSLYPTGGPVGDYLTLSGERREVELGAFLTPEERKSLAADLRTLLAQARTHTD